MKKMILFAFLLLAVPIAMLAQTDIPVPADVNDVLTNFAVWVGSFLGLSGLTVFVTALLIKLFNVTGSGLKQLISWGVGPVLVVALGLLGLGFAKDLIWYGLIAYAFAVDLAANKMFDIGLLQSILAMFKLVKPIKPVK